MDILYFIAFGVFCVDMMLNLIADPEYLGCACQNTRTQPGHRQGLHQTRFFGLRMGSFMLWCDMVSTAALLHDISYINSGEYSVQQIDLRLNEFGVPVRVSDQMHVTLKLLVRSDDYPCRSTSTKLCTTRYWSHSILICLFWSAKLSG